MLKSNLYRLRWLWLALWCVGGNTSMLAAAPSDGDDVQGVEFFESRIRPLFANKCYRCHSRESTKSKGGLLLDSPDGLTQGGDSGVLFVPGDVEKSLLIKAVRYIDPNLRMPPDGERLTEAEVADVEMWVKLGSPLPRRNAGEDKIKERARTHWAFQPVTQPPIPSVKGQDWVQSPIDAFILAKLESVGMQPAPPANKRTLIRRATYDLIGLPPTPEEVADFEADESPNAFAKVVDRLLRSQHYGERWGRHWLDIARFATSDGPYAFTYRDYVIRAFNDDLPYDEFLLQQIAADQLELGENQQALAGLGFLTVGKKFMNVHDTIDDRIDVVTRGIMALSVTCARCHDHKYDPISTREYYGLHGVFNNSFSPEELPLLGISPDPKAHAEYVLKRQALQTKLDDVIQKEEAEILQQHHQQIAQYLLLSQEPDKLKDLVQGEFGLSDRKLLQVGAQRWFEALKKMDSNADPIFAPWFAFAALSETEFAKRSKELSANIATNSRNVIQNSLVIKALTNEPPASLKEVADRYGQLFDDVDKRWQQVLQNGIEQHSDSPQALPDMEQEAIRQILYGKESPGNLPAEMMRQLFKPMVLMKLEPMRAEIERLEATHPGAPLRAMALKDSPHPANSRVFIRGNPNRPGDEAPRQFLAILSGDKREPFTQGSGRLELARAIASRENPLTARVMVNRVWMHHFGAGLVNGSDDFGLRSDSPSHPELLDYLAWRFMEDGWSFKKLHRLLILSSVYQQQCDDNLRYQKLDPDNRLLAKANRRRLDFESMRDTLLVVADNLDRSIGGRPVDLVKLRDGNHINRRTVYGTIDRNDLLSWYRFFDFANPDLSTAQRDTTTVPQQSLFFLNSAFVMEQALKMANRPSFKQLNDEAERLGDLYQRAYQRDPSQEELQRGLRFLETSSVVTDKEERINRRPLTPHERLAQVLLMSNELMFLD